MNELDYLSVVNMKSALSAFISVVNASGGYVDEDFWDAYLQACECLGESPMERLDE